MSRTGTLSSDRIYEIERTRASELRAIVEDWASRNGRKWVLGGPRDWSEDELVSAVCRIERGEEP